MVKDLTFGCTIPLSPPEVVLRYAILAERSGFDSVWLPNHILTTNPKTVCADTWTMISAIGMKTTKIKLCDGVSDPYRRNPSYLAQIVATVDQLTNGRVVLGLGAGEDMNLTPYGLSRLELSRGRRQILREAIQVIKKLWQASFEKPANFEGEFFRLNNAFLSIRPKQLPHPPIYIGAMGPKTRQLVGEIADGYYPLVINKDLFPKFVEDIKIGLRKSGRKLEEIDYAARVFTAISKEHDDARSMILDRAKRHLILDGGTTLRELGFDFHMKGNISTMLSGPETQKYIASLKDNVPDEAAESISIFGTVDDCIEQVYEYINLGASQLISFTTSEKTVVEFSKVINHFKDSRE